jgi:hypothetical protein
LGRVKSRRSQELIGASAEAVKSYLQSRFRDGMSWANYGTVWHIDHIRPCASFDLTRPEQQNLCFHYTNLQPLLVAENLKKGDRVIG